MDVLKAEDIHITAGVFSKNRADYWPGDYHHRPRSACIKIIPMSAEPEKLLRSLWGSVIEYQSPTEPVGLDQWETLNDCP